MCVFIEKSAFADPPPRHTVTRFLQSYGLTVFLEVVDFCDLIRAARLLDFRRPRRIGDVDNRQRTHARP